MMTKLRRMNFSASSGDADINAYLAAGNITDPTEIAAATLVITRAKSFNLWTKFDRWFLVSPTSQAASRLCCKTLNNLSEQAGMGWSSFYGWEFNGTAAYIKSGFTPGVSTHMQQNSASMSLFSNSGDMLDFAGGSLAGAFSGINNFIDLGVQGDIGSYQVTSNLFDYFTTGCNSGFNGTLQLSGFFGQSRTSSTNHFVRNDWWGGTETGASVAAHTATYPALEIYLGCYNAAGTATGFIIDTTGFSMITGHIGSGFSTTDLDNYYNIITDYNVSLGRNPF